MNIPIRWRLFLMMVLEFFIWGAWLPLIFGYLPAMGLSEQEQKLILSAFPVAAIVGMFFSNQFADRNFAAERFMAFSHLVGGLAMAALAWVKFDRPPVEAGGAVASLYDGPFWAFFGLMALHCFLYVPTISIANSIAFSHMKNSEREFGIVRMGGTVGWILAAWPIAFILYGKAPGEVLKATSAIFVISGVASLALAGFSLTSLPHTPPNRASGTDKLAWLKAVQTPRGSCDPCSVRGDFHRRHHPQRLFRDDRHIPREGWHQPGICHRGHESRPSRGNPDHDGPRSGPRAVWLARHSHPRHPRAHRAFPGICPAAADTLGSSSPSSFCTGSATRSSSPPFISISTRSFRRTFAPAPKGCLIFLSWG